MAKKAAKKAASKPRTPRKSHKPDANLKDATPGLKKLAAETAARSAPRPSDGIVPGPNVDLLNGHKVTPSEKIKSIAKGYINLKKDAQGAAGLISDMLGKAEERNHLNRKAFMAVMKFHTMSDAQLAIVWDVFLKYADDLKIPDRASAQQEMFKDATEEDEEEGQTDLEAAAEAAQGLSPSRRPSMKIVPSLPAGESSDAA
jgi:hypothetical protein